MALNSVLVGRQLGSAGAFRPDLYLLSLYCPIYLFCMLCWCEVYKTTCSFSVIVFNDK